MPEITAIVLLTWSMLGGLTYINTANSLIRQGKKLTRLPTAKKLVLLVIGYWWTPGNYTDIRRRADDLVGEVV